MIHKWPVVILCEGQIVVHSDQENMMWPILSF